MLKSVKFSGFKIFKNETTIDLVPTKSEILREYNVCDGLLRGGLFFGSNASGKTTALNAISLLLDMLFKEFVFHDYNICYLSKDHIAKFEYSFVIDKQEIKYSFSIKKGGHIVKEDLFLNDSQLINRIGTQATTSLIDSNEEKNVSSQRLYLRAIYFNNGFVDHPILQKWMKFLENSLYIDNVSSKTVTFTSDAFKETYLVSYLEKYGVDEINEFLSECNIPFKLDYQKMTMFDNQHFINIIFDNLKTKCKIPYIYESYGNKLLLQLLPYILRIKKTGGMLLIDEFGGGLHNKLTELIVNYIYKKTTNIQLFAVTHETNLLKTSLIRPDQIFIIDYDVDGANISKASNQSPRESQNLEKMYLSGVFGGIPLYVKD